MDWQMIAALAAIAAILAIIFKAWVSSQREIVQIKTLLACLTKDFQSFKLEYLRERARKN